jgi:hypothetical protein
MPIDRAKLRTLIKAKLLVNPYRKSEEDLQATYLGVVAQIDSLYAKEGQAALELISGRTWREEREILVKQKRALIGTMIRRGITVPNYEKSKGSPDE